MRLLPFVALPVLLAVSGCGVGVIATGSQGSMQIRGNVHGGQQPVTASSIQLYASGKSGNGSAGSSMLQIPVFTDLNGNFSLTANYTCANAEDQVYLVANGGNPGLSSGNNSALLMMDALGRCGDLPTTQFVTINELTTVAAAWTLAPFISSASAIGSTNANVAGLKNAFLNARLLVNPSTGTLAQTPANITFESGKVSALANSLAGCINSNGGSGCAPLFAAATPPGGTAPSNTLDAALNIVRNPSNNVADVFNAASSVPPFPTPLSTPPNDWTLSMTVTGGGLNSPTALSVDGYGNVWVAGYYGVLSAFTPQGTPLSDVGYGVGTLSEAYGLTVDSNNDVWVSIEEQPRHSPTKGSIAKFQGANSGNAGNLIGYYYDGTVDYPVAISADTNGNVVSANYANSSGSVFNTSGTVINGGIGTNNAAFPVAVAVDASHGVWLANQGDRTVTHIDASGNILRPSCCNGSNGIAVDSLGNAWVSNYYGTSVSEVDALGNVLFSGIKSGGISYPSGVVIDGKQDVWIANYRGTSITHLAGNGGTIAAGTALSPSTGFGQDASLLLPFGIGVDASGNVWVSNFANNDVVMFFGLATPTKTPVSPTPSRP